ncbi:MAG: ATP-binding protein [Actinomycetota bacterium]|nr:ATP-binding protein [Actinomycetota bacterium]
MGLGFGKRGEGKRPWWRSWWRSASWLRGRRALEAERLKRALAVERAEVADQLPDSVLEATREALINAGRHAAGAEVSVFMRADDASVQVFIHDRGPGFDPAAIPPYRHGINESIIVRMRRNGGDAEINSRPGEGCEIVLTRTRRCATSPSPR